MTREEAIGIMNYLKHYAETDIKERDVSEEKDRIRFIEALDMAIQALENHDTFMKYAYSQGKQDALSQEPISLNDINNAIEASFRNGVRSAKVEQEPCDDAISRKKAICVISACDGKSAQIEALEQLPSVTQKSGKWINLETNGQTYPFWGRYKCSVCGGYSENSDFCPHCGADMRGAE